jgi:hypothetical protein
MRAMVRGKKENVLGLDLAFVASLDAEKMLHGILTVPEIRRIESTYQAEVLCQLLIIVMGIAAIPTGVLFLARKKGLPMA